MSYQCLKFDKGDQIGIVTLNRPEVLNALNARFFDEIYQVFEEIEKDPEVRVVILTGAGEKAFAAGADIAEMQPQSSVQIQGFANSSRRACDRLSSVSKPVIAAINGFALGGGCEVAMCCDIRIAADTARFGQPEINLAIIPGAGGTQRLPRLVGMSMAKHLIFTGDMIDAAAAERIGLVSKVVPKEKLMDEAKEIARKIISKSAVALSAAKTAMDTGANTDLASGLDIEAQCFKLLFATEDQKEGMAAFLQKRKPQFKGK